MAQACTPTIITLSGCPHCANLESMLASAGITYNNDQSQSCQCYPCAVLCNGTHVTSCGGNAEYDVLAAIKTSIASATTPTSTTTPATTASTTPATASTAWKTSKWSNELSVDWGAANPKPTILQTPVGWTPPDVALTPVSPVPPGIAQGLTVAIRAKKKSKQTIGRKVA